MGTRKMAVSYHVFASPLRAMSTAGRHLIEVVQHPLPADAEVVDAFLVPEREEVHFVVESKEYDGQWGEADIAQHGSGFLPSPVFRRVEGAT